MVRCQLQTWPRGTVARADDSSRPNDVQYVSTSWLLRAICGTRMALKWLHKPEGTINVDTDRETQLSDRDKALFLQVHDDLNVPITTSPQMLCSLTIQLSQM